MDFIFGDALAFFERCEIHALAHQVVYLTAQSKHYAEEKSGYVFDHCRITVEKGADRVYLGRPWRAYSTVVWLETEMPAQLGAPSLGFGIFQTPPNRYPPARPLQLLAEASPA